MSKWKRWAPVFDTQRSLSEGDVGQLYQPRPASPYLRIARRLRRSGPLKAVIVGSRGSGKSTELVRLAHELRSEWLPIRLDLSGALDVAGSAVDLLVLLCAGVERW